MLPVRAYRGLCWVLILLVVFGGCNGAFDQQQVDTKSASEERIDYQTASSARPDFVSNAPMEMPGMPGVGAAPANQAIPAAFAAPAATPALHPARIPDVGYEEFRFQPPLPTAVGQGPGMGGDKYAHLPESNFVAVTAQPLSTFSIDVDTASYSKTRMYLMQHRSLPPVDSVRIEEFVNYFDYSYAPPTNDDPFAVHVEVAECPWKQTHLLARVGLKGREVERHRPPCNLVFLLDVSGSMNAPNRLPLVQECMRMLTSQLNDHDRVAIVVYAGAAGLVLPPTDGDRRGEILDAINQLHAGGSTNGGAGIQLAYQIAKQNLITGGVNRVMLCTDGDFNVGLTSNGDLVRLAESEAKSGVFLSVLGFGMGNHNDAMLEEISGKANGNYAFIDSESEGRKVFIEQINSTLVTIAKDVKIQIEFNPAMVASYRLIGYENRMLAAQDFNNDKKDAGEIGAGHTVTALYELVPHGGMEAVDTGRIDELKYQPKTQLSREAMTGELMTVKLRYKRPDAETSQLISQAVHGSDRRFGEASSDFRFAASVASFAMFLRHSGNAGDTNPDAIMEIAQAAMGHDPQGRRREFVELVKTAKSLVQGTPPVSGASYLPVQSYYPNVWYSQPMVRYVSRVDDFSLSFAMWCVACYLVVSAIIAVVVVVIVCRISAGIRMEPLMNTKV